MEINYDMKPFSLPNDSLTLLNAKLNDKTSHEMHMLKGADTSTSQFREQASYKGLISNTRVFKRSARVVPQH
jgi:hypothetical protein